MGRRPATCEHSGLYFPPFKAMHVPDSQPAFKAAHLACQLYQLYRQCFLSGPIPVARRAVITLCLLKTSLPMNASSFPSMQPSRIADTTADPATSATWCPCDPAIPSHYVAMLHTPQPSWPFLHTMAPAPWQGPRHTNARPTVVDA
jgi:hypothetical protein